MRASLRSFSALSVASLLCLSGVTVGVHAQTAKAVAASARITAPIDGGNPVVLPNHVPDYVLNASFGAVPSVAVDSAAQFNGVVMMLSRAPQVEAAWEQMLADQQDPSSPRYHQWLTPQQVGEQYGPAQSDIDAAVNWLEGQGLKVSEVSPSRVLITFSGSAQAISNAFRTSLRTYSLANGESRYSIAQNPSIPAGLTPVVAGIAGLSQAIHKPTLKRGDLVVRPIAGQAGSSLDQPNYTSTSSGRHYLLSSDFNAVFGVNTAATAGYNGAGQKIAVVGLSRVNALDVSRLQTLSGAAVKQPNVIIPTTGVDPGYPGDSNPTVDSGAQDEATLDIGRTTGTAPGATVDLIVSGNVGSGNTFATDGLYIAINYNINTQIDPIMSISFGGCEALNGSSVVSYEDSIFQTAASEGISTFVSSGDSSAASCNAFSATIPNPQQLSINDICASTYVTCVGGTEFADTANPGLYWSGTNNSTNGSSILSYIPEGAWNDVTAPSGTTTTYSYGGSGGGASVYIAKPSWQTGVGVLAGSFRLVPDVADPSSVHDGFVGCLNYAGGTCAGTPSSFSAFFSFGGTSAAAPTMAATQAIANQKLGVKQGNINPKIYQLAATTANNVFHDATVTSSGVSGCALTTPSMCNNSTPSSTSLTGGLQGYSLTTGWDAVTGWGTIDVNNYLIALTPGASTSIAVTATPNPIDVGALDTLTATLTPSLTTPVATGSVQFYSNGAPIGSPVTLASNKATLSYSFSSTGTYLITAAYSGDTAFAPSTSPQVSVVVNGALAFTVAATAPKTLTLVSGATTGNTIPVVIKADTAFAGTVALTCVATSGTTTGSCTLSQSSVTLTSGASATVTATIGSTAGTSGNIAFTVTGTNGQVVQSDTIGATLTASSLSVAGAITGYYTVAAGATTNNTEQVTITSVNGFTGNAALTCAFGASVGGGLTAANTSCTVSPTTVTLTANGTATATVTFVTTANVNGSASMTVTATGTTSGATLSTTGTVGLGLTAVAPAITITGAAPLTFAGNATTGLSETVTLTASNGFSGNANLTCSTGVTSPATCSVLPGSVTFTTNGTATATVTFAPTVHTSGTATATITATGGVTVGTATAVATVTKVGSTSVVTAPAATIGASDTLTATVTPASADGNLTGTVTFYNGATSLGVVTLAGTTAGPVAATLNYTPTSATALSVTAVYSGDGGYNTSSAATVPVTVSSYALASAGSLSFTSGASTGNTDVITATSSNGFAGTVSLTCSAAVVAGSPATPATCAIAPGSITLAANGTATATVTLTTVTAHAKSGTAAANHKPGFTPMRTGGAVFALMLCAVPFARRRKGLGALAVLVALVSSMAAMTGCGGGGNAPAVLSSSAGSYVVTVSGTSTATGTLVVMTTFNVSVN